MTPPSALTEKQIKDIQAAATNVQGGGHSMSMGRPPQRRYDENTGEEYWTDQQQATYRCANSKMSAILKLIELAPQIAALCDLAKIALSPPQDVAGLVSELRGLAEKATPGPWRRDDLTREIFDSGEYETTLRILAADGTEVITQAWDGLSDEEPNFDYAAAANPANITKLLDCVTSLSARNRELEAGMSDDLVNLLIEFKNGNSPHPLVRIDRESAQPRYAIWQSQLDELIHEITRLRSSLATAREDVIKEAVTVVEDKVICCPDCVESAVNALNALRVQQLSFT